MVLNYLKKRILGNTLSKLNLRLSGSFEKVNEDIRLINEWIKHLHSKSEIIKGTHDTHVSLNRQEIENMNRWINYLNQHSTELRKNFKDTSKKVDEMASNYGDLMQRIQKMEQDFQEFGKVTRVTKSDTKVTRKSDVENDVVLTNVNAFSLSEKKLIYMLCNSDNPLDYNQLARALRLNYSTVKNIIYSSRKKGLDVKNSIKANGEKGFYVEKKMKIHLTGR